MTVQTLHPAVTASAPDMIAAAVRSRGITLRALAEQSGLPANACSAALQKPYHKAELAIARFLQVEPASLWPERWTPDGKRLRPQPRENYITKARFGRPLGEAA